MEVAWGSTPITSWPSSPPVARWASPSSDETYNLGADALGSALGGFGTVGGLGASSDVLCPWVVGIRRNPQCAVEVAGHEDERIQCHGREMREDVAPTLLGEAPGVPQRHCPIPHRAKASAPGGGCQG